MFSLQQAARNAPTLAHLFDRIRHSEQMLHVVQPLLPPGLRAQVQAGPLDDASWCLLVSNPAEGAKLKQLTPALLAALRHAGFEVPELRIKVRTSTPVGTKKPSKT